MGIAKCPETSQRLNPYFPVHLHTGAVNRVASVASETRTCEGPSHGPKEIILHKHTFYEHSFVSNKNNGKALEVGLQGVPAIVL